jgi:hypothetical protein
MKLTSDSAATILESSRISDRTLFIEGKATTAKRLIERDITGRRNTWPGRDI